MNQVFKKIEGYFFICFRKGVIIMKRNFLNLCLVVLSVFVFFSCLDETDDIYVSYGVLQNVNNSNDYEILTDKGNTLVVTKSFTGQKIENDKRVLVNFEILSDKDKNKNVFEIKVNGFYSLLSKPMVSESHILQNEGVRRDSIGNDPFVDIAARFSGDFLNIDFELFYEQGSNKKHMINLVYDDTRESTDTLYLRLYHNAYGEVPGKGLYLYRGYGRSSFKISDLVANASSKPVNLTWTEFNSNLEPIERSKTVVFNPDGGKSFERSVGFNDCMEVK